MSVERDSYDIQLNKLLPDKFNSELLQDLLDTLEQRFVDLTFDKIRIFGQVYSSCTISDTTLYVKIHPLDSEHEHLVFKSDELPTDIDATYYFAIWHNKFESDGLTYSTLSDDTTFEIVKATYVETVKVDETTTYYTYTIERGKHETESSAHAINDYVTYFSPISVKEIIDKINTLIPLLNPNNTPNEYLQNLADLIGTTLSSIDNTSDVTRRAELLETVNWYKMKGTYASVKVIAALSKLSFRIFEYYTEDETSYNIPTFSETEWFVGVSGSLPSLIPNTYFKTPHFGIYIDLATVYDAVDTYEQHLWRDSLYEISTNPDYGIKSYVEKTRPVNTVPHYALLLEVKTTECGEVTNLYDVNGRIYSSAKITELWQYSDIYFDEPDSMSIQFDDEYYLDDSSSEIQYFDNDITSYLATIDTFKIGTLDEDLNSSNGVEFDTVNYTGTITRYAVDSEFIIFYMTIPASQTLIFSGQGATELGLFNGESNNDLVAVATFPDIYKGTALDLNIQFKIARTTDCTYWDLPEPYIPDMSGYILFSIRDIEACGVDTDGVPAEFMNLNLWIPITSTVETIYGQTITCATIVGTTKYIISGVFEDYSYRFKYGTISIQLSDSNPYASGYETIYTFSGYLKPLASYTTDELTAWAFHAEAVSVTENTKIDCTGTDAAEGKLGAVGTSLSVLDVETFTVIGEDIQNCDTDEAYQIIDTELVYNGTFDSDYLYWISSNFEMDYIHSYIIATDSGFVYQPIPNLTPDSYYLVEFTCFTDTPDDVSITLSDTSFALSSITTNSFMHVGESSNITISDGTHINPEAGSFAISFWYRTQNLNTALQNIEAFKNSNDGFTLTIGKNDINLLFTDENDFPVSIGNSSIIDDGKWHNFIFVMDRVTTLTYTSYIDGVLHHTEDIDGIFTDNSAAIKSGDLYIGKNLAGIFVDVDNFRFFKSTLTQANVTAIWNNGLGTKYTGVAGEGIATWASDFDEINSSDEIIDEVSGNNATITGSVSCIAGDYSYSYILTAGNENNIIFSYEQTDTNSEYCIIDDVSIKEIKYNTDFTQADVLNATIELAVTDYPTVANNQTWTYELKDSSKWIVITLRFDETIETSSLDEYDSNLLFCNWYCTIDAKVNSTLLTNPADADYSSVFTYSNYLTKDLITDSNGEHDIWYQYIATNEKTTCSLTDISEGYLGNIRFLMYENDDITTTTGEATTTEESTTTEEVTTTEEATTTGEEVTTEAGVTTTETTTTIELADSCNCCSSNTTPEYVTICVSGISFPGVDNGDGSFTCGPINYSYEGSLPNSNFVLQQTDSISTCVYRYANCDYDFILHEYTTTSGLHIKFRGVNVTAALNCFSAFSKTIDIRVSYGQYKQWYDGSEEPDWYGVCGGSYSDYRYFRGSYILASYPFDCTNMNISTTNLNVETCTDIGLYLTGGTAIIQSGISSCFS